MAFVIADRVRETTTTTGTGAVTLAGAYPSFQTFSAAIGNANNTYYTIASATSGEWEVGIGTYTSGTNSLSRDTVLSSSNAGSLVTFSAGSKDVFVTQPSARSLLVQSAGSGLFAGTAAFTSGGAVYASSTTVLTSGTLPVTAGGLGIATGTSGGVPYFSGSTTIASSAALAANALVIGGGAGAAPATTTTAAGILTFLGTPSSANLLSAMTDETGSGLLVFGTSPSLTTPALSGETFSTSAAVTAGTNAQGQGALTSDYNVITTAAANPSGVTLPTATTGRRVIVVNKGANAVNVYPATGGTIDALAANTAISLAVNGYIEFNASSTTQWYSSYNAIIATAGVTSFSAGTTGLTPSTATTGAITLAGTLAAANGGTGQSSYAVGDLLYASTTTALSKLADVATGNALISGGVGVAPSWGKIGLTTHVSGTLPVANGGTGLTAGTSGGVLYYSAAGTLASSAALAANALVIGGGAGVAPSTTTTGTGVVTALGVNVGTAGAFVVNGGALGTPSSGTVTNLTGTASININGTVGATTPNTGAFTSVTSTSASGVLTRAAATQDGIEMIGRAGGTTSLKVSLTPTTLTASRTVTFPDANTTVPVATQVITFSGPTAARTYTFPDANATVLTTNAVVTVAQGGTGTSTAFTAGSVVFAGASGVYTQNNAAFFWDNTNSRLGIGTASPAVKLAISATDAILLPKGTTAQQPTGVAGYLRFNTDTNQFEGYNGTAWSSVGGASLSNDTSTATNVYPLFAAATTGSATTIYTSNAKYLYKPSTGELQASEVIASNGIFVNSQTVATSYTIAAGNSAMSSGPVTVASGQAVTVSSGSRWVVI